MSKSKSKSDRAKQSRRALAQVADGSRAQVAAGAARVAHAAETNARLQASLQQMQDRFEAASAGARFASDFGKGIS